MESKYKKWNRNNSYQKTVTVQTRTR